MQNTLKLAAILLALAQLSSQCGNGCLKCTVPEVCDLCDFSNAFILDDGKCVHKPLQDCLTYNLEGKCLVCKEGLYLNLDQQKCLPIQTYKEIEHCLYYTPQGNCSLCNTQFYLNGSVCAPLETEISNCAAYNTKNTCQECEDNFILSVDQKNCVSVIEDSKCLGYSLNKCITCNEQSVVDVTYYQTLIKEKATDLNSVNQQYIFNYFTQERHYYFETCILKKVSNCAEFQDFKTCTKCKQGHYLQDNECKQNPQNFIPYCYRYENINKCIECQHGYFLESDVSCKAIEPIEHCILYNGASTKTQCKECEEKFYLQGDETCIGRTLEVENCMLYATNNNICSKCIDGMILSSDQKKCLLQIENCQQYQSSSMETINIQCFTCKAGFYLQNNICEVGSVVNCEVYHPDQNVCQQCKNKYYLNSGECKLHGDINNCEIYSQNEVGKCTQCRSGTVKFPKSTSCNAVIPIEGCLTYSEPDKCQRCMDGYNFVSETQCDPIPSNNNCTYQKQGVCEVCNEGYFLDANKDCVLPISYGLEFCDESEINVTGILKCNVCKPGSFAYQQNTNYICRSEDALKRGWNVDTLTNNCQRYKKDNNQAVCTQCNEGTYLLDTDKTCSQTCTGTIYRVKKVGDDLFKNYCMAAVEDNCKFKSLKQAEDGQPHSCLQCQDNFYAKVDFTSTLQILGQSIDNQMTSKENNLYYKPEITCTESNNNTKVRSNNNQLLNKCEYYYDLHNDEIGCAKCQQGYDGLIKNWEVKNCVTYDEQQKVCTKCINTHKLSVNGLECTPLNTIQNCQRYKNNTQDICELCKTNFYLQAPTTCSPVTEIPNCQMYQMDQNKCIRCKTGYRFNNAKDVCYSEIQKCKVYSNPNTADDTAICTTCQDGYYPINQNQKCEKGNVMNCWKYKQNRVNECEFYNNNIPFEDQNICTPVKKIEGCSKYSSIDTCSKCNPNSHYLSGNTCCPFRYFNTGSKCEQILISNCKVSDSLNTCTQCLEGFYPDLYQQEVNPPHVCCGQGSYYHPKDLECSSRLDVSLNEIGCSLFSDSKLKCVHCKEGYYLSSKRFCCPLGEYHAIENNKNVCKSIPDSATNCVKYNGFDSECTECKTFEQGDEYKYFLGTNSKKCCKLNFESDTNQGCTTNLTGCKTVNANGTDCDTCRDNYNLEGTKCCAKKDTDQTPQYIDNTTCTDVTNAIDNCIYYKKVNNNVVCSECDDDYVLSNSNQTCCPMNTVYVGTKCVDTQFVYSNCARVNLTTNLCNLCDTGYYLYNGLCIDNGKVFNYNAQQINDGSTTNCKEYDVNNACTTCETGFTLTQSKECTTQMLVNVNGVDYTYDNLIRGCAYFDFTQSKCIKCKGGYYKNGNDLMCCQYGEKLNSNECVALTDNTCQTVDANDACTLRSSNTVANCMTSIDNQTCTECNLGYYLNNGVCKSESDVNKLCSNFLITSNCKEIDLTNCTCTSCQVWAYGEHCCQNGQRWDTNTLRCVNISEDMYCAQWNSDTSKCAKCFFDNTLKTIPENYKWIYKNSSDSNVASTGFNAYPNDFNIWNDTNAGRCCPLGQGIKDGRCQYTTITNCRKPVYANNAWTCSECNYGYVKANNDTQCNQAACANDYYESNGVCCPKGQYFNKEDSRCHPIIDSNCSKSNEGTSCTEECKANYSKRLYMESTLAELYIKVRPQGPAYYMKKMVQLCEPGTDISAQLNENYVKKIVENCQQFDAANSKCSICKDGYYLETNAAMCCANDKALVTLKEGDVVQNAYCYTIANLLDNCADYDTATKKCKNCFDTYNLSYGRCCPANKHFNVTTATCVYDSSNCALYDSYNGICKLCNNGYHLSNSICVTTDKYYNKPTTTAVVVQNQFTNCSKVTDSPNNECLEVVSNSNSYLHRGRSCQLGYYNNGTECLSINTLGTEYQNCQELDHTNKCQSCNSNYYYTNGRCCKDQEYFEPYIKKCMPINKYRNCLQASKDKEDNCQVCEQGYYKGAYGFCVLEGKKITDQYGSIDDITIENCTQVSDNNQCIQCTGTKVIYDNQCLDYDNIQTLQRIGGCRIIKAGTPPTCLECQDNFYLTKEDEKCCQFGTYFDGADCTSLSLIALNCKEYEYGTCKQCQDGFYLSNGSACCQEGQYAKSASECAGIDLLNCAQSSNNGVCEKCNQGFMLVNGVCKTLNNIDNCSIGATAELCLICNTGFYLNDNGQCIAQDDINGCDVKTNNKNTCQTCAQGLYYDGYQCCATTKYTRITGVIKDQQNGYSCVNLQPTTQTNCQRIDNGQCVSCGTDQYLFNNECCPYGQYHDGNNCVASTSNGLENCRIFKDANTCQEYTNEKDEDMSCLNSKYFHLKHCCSIDQYWNTTNSACEANSTVTQYNNCKKLNDQMQCIECSSGYLSDGLCCDEGKYNVAGTCTNITVTDCLQYDGVFCSKCGNNKDLSSFNRCCDQNYYFSDQTCNAKLTEQNEFDIFNETLVSCTANNYPANNKLCCADSQYDNAGTCTDLTNKTTCLKVYKGGADNTCALCKEEDGNNVAFQAFKNVCKAQATFVLFYNNDANTFDAARDSVITHCQQMDNTGLCKKCKSGKNLSQGICLAEQFLDASDTANIQAKSLLTNCQQGADGTTCTTCNSGYFKTNDGSACCVDGKIATDDSTCSATDATVPNCIKFTETGDAGKSKCQICKTGYNTYDSAGDQSIITCCANGQRPKADNVTCETFGYNIDKCAKFDHLTNKCLECKPTVNNEKYYLSVNSVCCKEGEMFDTQTSQCTSIVANTYPDCVNVSTVNNASVCTKCSSTTYASGANAKVCCANGKFNDTNTPCADITATNCKEANAADDCLVCNTDYTRLIVANKGVCCQESQYYSGTACVDIPSDKNCLKVPDNATDANTCKVCKSGYLLTEDTKTCCQANDITGTTCKKNQLLYQTDVLKLCGEWDRKGMNCIKCSEQGYYASNGGCCQEGKYSKVDSDAFTCIDIPVNNCQQHDDTNGCSVCSSGYLLDKSKSTDNGLACVQSTIANGYTGCLKTDNNLTKCEECQEGYYLHKDRCAPIGQKRNTANNTSEDITIDNCLKMKSDSDTDCEVCKNEYYLTLTKTSCCKEGTYLLNGNCVEQGGANDPKPIENCAIFKDDPVQCLKCKFGYVKGTKLGGAHICLKFRDVQSEELCEEAYISIANQLNTFNCTKCKNHEIDYVLRTTKANRNIQYDSLKGCTYYDTQIQLSQSSLTCKVCDDNSSYYLDNAGVCQKREVTNLIQCIGEMPYNEDKCTACNVGYYLDNNNVCQEIPVDNCMQYNGTNCEVCNDGFKLMKQDNVFNCVDVQTFVDNLAQSPTFFKGYIDDCTQQNTCVNYYVGGISTTLTRLFSCHLCTFKDMIPFVSIRTIAGQNNDAMIESIQRYKKSLNGETQDQGSELNSSQCMKPIADTFNIQNNQFNFPNNCSLGMINSSLTPTAFESNSPLANASNLGIYCVACKPGYKAFYGQVTHQVYKCESINYCDEQGDNFNECKTCSNGYVFKYNPQTKLIQKDSCEVFTLDQNCFAADFTDQNNFVCKFCKRGYSINKAGFCEQTISSNCLEGKFERQDSNDIIQTNNEELLLRFQDGQGCQQCKDNYIKSLETSADYFCESSPVVQSKTVYSNTQVYQANCLQYDNTSDHKCVKCNEGSVLNIYGTCLESNTSLQNCSIAESQDLCKTCNENFMKLNNVCVVKDIDNCVVYIDNPTDGKKRCSVCADGYGLDNGLCAKDLFNSCVEVDEDGNCQNCLYGFHLVTLKDDKKSCIEVITHQNCKTYSTNNFQSFNMRCTECESNQFVLTDVNVNEVCNPLPQIKNCKTYDIKNTFETSTLNCLECRTGYYLLSNECLPRLNLVKNCTTYELDSQLCLDCELNYYLSLDKKKCVENPRGIQHCKEYKSNTECQVCQTQYYVLEGECKQVKTENVVQMCDVYDSNQTCSKCVDNYILGANVCESIVASNCLEIEDRTTCKSCSFGFKLETVESVTSCVKIEKENIQNCQVVSDTTPFVCIKCNDGYYVMDGQCEEVEQKIPMCKEYESPFICAKCDNYSILSVDRTTCASLINQNCLEAEEQNEGFCVVCKPGYILQDNKCVFMTGEFNEAAENCMVYQEQPENGKLGCLICQRGYSMNEVGICKRTQVDDSQIDVPEEPTENEDNTSNLMIYSIINYTLWFFYAFF